MTTLTYSKEGYLRLDNSGKQLLSVFSHQHDKSKRWRIKVKGILTNCQNQKHRGIFLTLTVRSCSVENVETNILQLHTGFSNVRKYLGSTLIGWIMSTEVTYTSEGCHPHLHIYLAVKPDYFGAEYLTQQNWVDLWQNCLNLDYEPILDVRSVKNIDDICWELTKPNLKSSSDWQYTQSKWLNLVLTKWSLMRSLYGGGILKK